MPYLHKFSDKAQQDEARQDETHQDEAQQQILAEMRENQRQDQLTRKNYVFTPSKAKSLLNFKSNKGAIAVEYVLLLVACVAIATAITDIGFKIDNNKENRGFVIGTWMKIIENIAEDM